MSNSVGRLALKPPGIRRMSLFARIITYYVETPCGVMMLTHHWRLEGKPPYCGGVEPLVDIFGKNGIIVGESKEVRV